MCQIVLQIYSDRLQSIRNQINLHLNKILNNPLFSLKNAQLDAMSYEQKIKILTENEALLRRENENPDILNMIGVIQSYEIYDSLKYKKAKKMHKILNKLD